MKSAQGQYLPGTNFQEFSPESVRLSKEGADAEEPSGSGGGGSVPNELMKTGEEES